MIHTTLAADQVRIVCSPDTLLAEYSFAIEQGIDWFFGSGVTAFKVQRSKNQATQEQVVEIVAAAASKPLAYSLVSKVSLLAKEGYWPNVLPVETIWPVPPTQRPIQGRRIFRTTANQTIIEMNNLPPCISIGELAYGLSDLITGVFWLGATWVQHQSSMTLTQTMVDLGLEPEEVLSYLADERDGFSVHQRVCTLS